MEHIISSARVHIPPAEARRSAPDRPEIHVSRVRDQRLDAPISGIRCPICRWRPERQSRWTCWDCEHPEYFYGGCGTEWNTFETGGKCPTCEHRWQWTTCLSCWVWSRHEEWYEDQDRSG